MTKKAEDALRTVLGDETVEVLQAVGAIIVPGGMPGPDFTFADHRSIVVFTAISEAAIAELDEMALESWQLIGEHGFGVDHRPAAQLIEQLKENGFSVEQA